MADRLRIVTGDVTRDGARVAEAVQGQDLVISALGRRSTFRSEELIARSMDAIVPSMKQAGVRRIILTSAFGVGDSLRDAPLIPGIMYRVLLTNGPLSGRYRAAERLELHGMPKISRADVAHCILAEAESPRFVNRVAVISY